MDAESRAFSQSRFDRYVSAQISNHCTNMCETDAVPRLILRPRTPEELEYTLPIIVGNAPAVVGHFYR